MRRVVVVGGGAAGATAASKAKRVNPSAQVVLIEASPYITHAPCAVPYALKYGTKLYLYTAEEFASQKGVEVYVNTKAEPGEGNRLRLTGAHSGVLEWDVLVIATGASPRIPPIEGVDLRGVYVVRHPAEVWEMRASLEKAARVVVVGGGYIGVEMAEVLLDMGKRVTLVEPGRWVLNRMVDGELGRWITEYMQAMGVDLRLGEGVVRISGKDGVVQGVETTKGALEGDAVVLATGVRPNVELAKALGARLGETGAVWTDPYMETSVPGVYAAGDVAEAVSAVTGRPVWLPLAPYANKMGYVAGVNAATGDKVLRFPPVVGATVTKFFDMYIGRAGISEVEAKELGWQVRTALITTRDRAAFIPGGREIRIKAVAVGDVLVGVQVAGYTPYVAGVVDLAAQFIGKPLSSVILAEFSYMPYTGPVWHPLVAVARLLD